MDIHAEVPLVSFLGMVHLRIPLPYLVPGGAWRCDQGGIDDRALPHRHAPCIEVSVDDLKNLLAQPMLLQQVAEGEDRGFIRDRVANQLDAGKAAHRGHLDQGLLHRRVAERIPLLQQIDPQHRRQWIGRAAVFLARLGVVGLKQIDQCQPGHHRLHLSEKLLALGLLLGCGQLVIREAELRATDYLNLGLRSQGHCPFESPGFPRASLIEWSIKGASSVYNRWSIEKVEGTSLLLDWQSLKFQHRISCVLMLKLDHFRSFYRSTLPKRARQNARNAYKRIIYISRFVILFLTVRLCEKKLKIVLGSALTSYSGWHSTNEQYLDITQKEHWQRLFKSPQSITAMVAEHVFEHLSYPEMMIALSLCYQYLIKGGTLLVAVPDGNHPEAEYRLNAGINGIGPDACDHKQFLTSEKLRNSATSCGFSFKHIEGYTDKGNLINAYENFQHLGYIRRSRLRGTSPYVGPDATSNFIDSNTSLIVLLSK